MLAPSAVAQLACQIKFWGPVAANPSPARANLARTTPPIHPNVSLRQGQR
jgi:hypothetical protein